MKTPFDKRALLEWYGESRRDLPWRRTRDPYAIWISETMLQQTRVETVLPYYARFLRELPDVVSLAEATEERVLALWSGLGYYRRARMLHAAARTVAEEHGGRLPEDAAGLRRLEGIGAYTAGAIASIAFGKRAALVDGNVARVLARLFAIEEDVKSGTGAGRVWELAEQLVAEVDGPAGDWNQALMELGATVCTPREPRCDACPISEGCEGRALGIAGELPRTLPKRRPLEVKRVALVIASASHVVLARRRRETLFGGLWEPPFAHGDDPGPLVAALGVTGTLRPGGRVVHVLSHRRMEVDVCVAPLGRRRRWALPGEDYDAIEVARVEELSSRPHSTLARKVLVAAGVVSLAKAPGVGLRSHSK
ncbi:MAG TPA: A/G-specific adenine glycosylase [Polyangiaceae bacterium]